MIKVTVKEHNLMTDDMRSAWAPMRAISQVATALIVRRVFRKAQGSTGRDFGKYNESRRGSFWVDADLPQPAEGRLAVSKKGRARYESRRSYKEALHGAGLAPVATVTFQQRGLLWRGLIIKPMSMTKARITFTGKNKNMRNAKVSGLTKSKQNPAVLSLSDKEVAVIERLLASMAFGRWVQAAKIHQLGMDSRRAMDKFRRERNKAKKMADQALAEVKGGPAR